MGSAVSTPDIRQHSLSLWWLIAPASVLIFAVLAAINIGLFQQGFASKSLLYLGEKALLVFHGRPPRLENLGFVYPPLPYLFVLLFRDAFWAGAFVGSVAACAFLIVAYHTWVRGHISWWFFLLIVVFVCLSPLSLFMLSQQLQMCLMIAVLMQAYYHLYRYVERRLSFDLFIFGLLTGLLFYTQFLSVFVIPLFLLALLLGSRNRDWKECGAVLATGFFPALFLSVSWCYINWLFMKNPFYFVEQWQSAFSPENSTPQALLAAHDAWLAAKLTGRLCVRYTPLILPYWVVVAALLLRESKVRAVSLTVLLTPVWLLYLLVAGGNFEFNASFFLLFLTTAFLVRIKDLRHMKSPWLDKILIMTIALSLISSFWISFAQGSLEERQFTRGLFNRGDFANLTNYRALLARINASGRSSTVLLDDTHQFPLVLLDGQPKRFILPYEYEYGIVLSAPHRFAEYLVISVGGTKDRVGGRFPLARFGYVENYKPAGRFGNLLLFRRSMGAS